MIRLFVALLIACLAPAAAFASSPQAPILNLHMTASIAGVMAIALFVFAYILVMTEEVTHLHKSKPVIIAAGLIWVLVAWECHNFNIPEAASKAVRHNILEYAELFLFLLVAMTYINVLEERQVFTALRVFLTNRGYNYRQLFWATGAMAFVLSPIADNLTTALLMCAVIMAVGKDNANFVKLSCINIVVAANAGGAFSPFGDITTLMVWQRGHLDFFDFFAIFLPSVAAFVVPAACMHFAVEQGQPRRILDRQKIKFGGIFAMVLFLFTVLTAVVFHYVLKLPPVIGMMTGLGYLNFYSYYLNRIETRIIAGREYSDAPKPFDIFNLIKEAEWDTLFFFYGVVLSVGGLAAFGYLAWMSEAFYQQLGTHLSAIHHATPANILVGVLSAIIDNIPVMFAVITMDPSMSQGQWLLVTLTAGIGGSLLSIGSAAGVALMGQAKGYYTFSSHLKWSWAILLGFIAACALHIWLNHAWFLTKLQ